MKIVVSGSTGFIGSHLVNYLLKHTNHDLVGLSRSECQSSSDRLEYKTCDLYSLLDAENSLVGCDVAIYLVHSMNQGVRLSQGSFEDFDFILADNFAKACERNNVKRIIYVSGIVPLEKVTSAHLKSRLEVEKTLLKHKTPLTAFRTGIVMGPEGSSFDIVRKIINRLFFIVLPNWTLNKIQVLSIQDLNHAILIETKNDKLEDGSFDLAHPKVFRYAGLIKKISKLLNKKNVFFKFPYVPYFISKRWITLITGYSKYLVFPLVDSLKYSMVVDETRRWPLKKDFKDLEESIKWSWNLDNAAKLPILKKEQPKKNSLVRSVQRLHKPNSWTMNEVALEYMRWLERFFKPFLKIDINGDNINFNTYLIKKPLLSLRFSRERTFETRRLFYIVGGILAKKRKNARLEFRESPDQEFFIAAIHSYHPSLPWYIYRYTQALVHAFVMKKFGQHLKSVSKSKK